MIEAEWLACTQPLKMLHFLRRRASERKFRLFACGSCRRIWRCLPDERSRRAVEVAELFADERTDLDTLQTALHAAHVARQEAESAGRWWNAAATAAAAAEANCQTGAERAAVTATDADAVRDVFGNPFRPVAFDPAWRTPRVLALAQAVYEERAFDRLPILADALEEAGCDNAALLAHCREPGLHARGCWAVDAVLGKK